MENMDQISIANQHNAILNRLVEISLVLNSSLSIDDVLRHLMDATTEILNTETASVILKDDRTNELYFLAMPTATELSLSQRLERVPIPLENSIAGSIIRENQAIVSNDITQDPRHYSQTDNESGFQTRSLLGVPMRIKDRVVGALEAVNKIEGEWTESDQHYLEILASQAAIAFENAQLVQKLQKANDELSQLDKLKNDFIAVASHELRTPLGVILGYASFLKDEAQGDLSDHANAVLNSALRMRNLIEDMTNLRFLQAKDLDFVPEQIAIDEIMRMVSSDIESMVDIKGHRLQVIMPEQSDVTIIADQIKLQMALTNILNNAIKFTPSENGHIQVRCVDRPHEVWFQVQDNGVGIPPEEQEDIFRAFYQVEDHMTRRHGGLGTGLAIAKAVAEIHNGRIWVESDGENMGATFTISIPKPE